MDMREAMTPPEPSLSLVMPAFNEQATILEAVGRVLEQPFVAELIIVDDASTDGTADLIATIDDPRVIASSRFAIRIIRAREPRCELASLGLRLPTLEFKTPISSTTRPTMRAFSFPCRTVPPMWCTDLAS